MDAHGCRADALRSLEALQAVFARLVSELTLHPLGEPVWHRFPDPGGITGLLALRESHLACHTFPERRYAAFSFYCCRPREAWPWSERLRELLGTERVEMRAVERGSR